MTFEAAAGNQQPMRSGGTYDGKIAGLYDLGETLGSGHFAVVKQARHVFTGTKVAVKVVDKTKLDEVSKAHLFQEVRCMKLVQHPNVVRLYEVIDTQTKLYLVLELGDGGDLYDYIMKHEGGLSQNLARKYFRQILRAITYCHKLHVVHRDLKPENVVFFEKLGLVKLTDFGFSNKFSPGQKLETFCGSLAYSAPEILLGDSYDAPAVDIWSLGVILYMLVCGQPPFEKANDSETLTMIMDCKYTVPSRIANGCRDLIASMLVRDPKKRASLEVIAADTWLSENSNDDMSDFVPLVSRQEIIEEDHTFIVQKMVNGNIASKDEIQKSLDTNKYDHITATYFLLAEMKLRKRQEEHNAEFNVKSESNKRVSDNRVHEVDGNMIPVNLNVCPPNINEPKMPLRSRKCSIVREEEEDESASENVVGNANELKVAVMRRESISDGRINQTIQENANAVPLLVAPRISRKKLPIDAVDDLVIAENDTFIEKDVRRHIGRSVPVNDALKGLKDIEIGKFKSILGNNKNSVLSHRRAKLNKARTPSCSSSEASDDDTKVRNRKKLNKFVGDTPTRFRMHRRDSYDDSSDSQDQTFPPADSNTSSSIINNSNNSTDKTKCQNQSKEQKKDDNHKSSNTNTRKNKRQSKEYASNHYRTASYSGSSLRRHSQGESLSLDRINEAQECEIRYSTPASSVESNISILNYRASSMTKAKLINSGVEGENIVHIRQSMDVVTVEENSSDLGCIKEQTNLGVYNLKLIREIDKVFFDEENQAKSMEDNAKLNYMANFLPVVHCS